MKKWRFITTACRQVPNCDTQGIFWSSYLAESGSGPYGCVKFNAGARACVVTCSPITSTAPTSRTTCPNNLLLRPLPLLLPRPRLLLPDQLCCIVLTAKRPLLLLRPLLFPLLLLLSVLPLFCNEPVAKLLRNPHRSARTLTRAEDQVTGSAMALVVMEQIGTSMTTSISVRLLSLNQAQTFSGT